jgi:F-type H+-transporting ATPase subunit b
MKRLVSLARASARFDLKQTLLVCATLLVPALALATDGEAHAEHGEHGWDTTGLIASFVNFAILVGVFVYLFRQKLSDFLKQRKASVEQALSEAARMKAEAEAKHKEYTERLAQLDQELATIKREMVAAGVKERDRIVAEAEQKAARMRREAEFIIEQYVKQLRSDLSREAAEGAVQAAEALLLTSTTNHDQQRLAQDYLGTLSSKIAERQAEPKKPPLNSLGTESRA